jgi:uncharacterized membrane protein
MSQNRNPSADRQTLADDYEVNLEAEIKIMTRHQKMAEPRAEQLVLLRRRRREQIDHSSRHLAKIGITGRTTV